MNFDIRNHLEMGLRNLIFLSRRPHLNLEAHWMIDTHAMPIFCIFRGLVRKGEVEDG
jgi:hypothetical protein